MICKPTFPKPVLQRVVSGGGSLVAAVAGWVVICLIPLSGRGQDLLISAGGSFDPFLLALKPAVQMSPLPAWMPSPAVIKPSTATIEVPIAPLWQHAAVEMYAVTVVFEDNGDGGPALEWQEKPSEAPAVISYGLGEIGRPVGLNSRTVLLPQALTKQGGALLLSYYGKFDSLLSLAVRPAREDWTAVLGGRRTAVLIDQAFQVFDDREVNGSRPIPLSGDVRNGMIVEAELSAAVEPLESSIEFVVPLEGTVEGAMLHLETLGLDPEARLEVTVNAVPCGAVSFPAFTLDDPSLVGDWNGRLVLAGWRKGSAFIPARHLKQGENSAVITLKRSEGETGRQVFLKNTMLHLRFAPPEFTDRPTHLPEGNSAEVSLSEPDFTLDEPAIPSTEDPPPASLTP
jgi:hypothetical protein